MSAADQLDRVLYDEDVVVRFEPAGMAGIVWAFLFEAAFIVASVVGVVLWRWVGR